eukprot:1587985-Pyramimonas_sp.AAC.1
MVKSAELVPFESAAQAEPSCPHWGALLAAPLTPACDCEGSAARPPHDIASAASGIAGEAQAASWSSTRLRARPPHHSRRQRLQLDDADVDLVTQSQGGHRSTVG